MACQTNDLIECTLNPNDPEAIRQAQQAINKAVRFLYRLADGGGMPVLNSDGQYVRNGNDPIRNLIDLKGLFHPGGSNLAKVMDLPVEVGGFTVPAWKVVLRDCDPYGVETDSRFEAYMLVPGGLSEATRGGQPHLHRENPGGGPATVGDLVLYSQPGNSQGLRYVTSTFQMTKHDHDHLHDHTAVAHAHAHAHTHSHTHTGDGHVHAPGSHTHTGPSHTHTQTAHAHEQKKHTHTPIASYFGFDSWVANTKTWHAGYEDDDGGNTTPGQSTVEVNDPSDMAAINANTLTDNSGGTPNTTIAVITNAANAGSADVGPTADAIADLAAQVNNLKTDVDNVKSAYDGHIHTALLDARECWGSPDGTSTISSIQVVGADTHTETPADTTLSDGDDTVDAGGTDNTGTPSASNTASTAVTMDTDTTGASPGSTSTDGAATTASADPAGDAEPS